MRPTLGPTFALILPPLLVAVMLLAAVELASFTGVLPPWLVPAPSAVFAALAGNAGPLWKATQTTLQASMLGFAVAIVGGVLLAVLLSSSRLVERALYPYAVLFQTVPIVAITPLLVIWFGLNRNSVIASAAIVSVFPIIANTLGGLRSTDPALVDLFRLYRSGPLSTLLRLRVPWAIPNVLTGLRVGAGLAVIGAIVGEFTITNQGLGGVIVQAVGLQRPSLVWAALLISAAIGVGLFAILGLLQWLLLRHWHASARAGS